ncbi:hypothetical protein FUAX_27290 [Fulvitalea axinellae]|uniref:Uncharacterized protein n=1 Tax=Fulvitalea axinellae TaxID=1182444 RepID=A0AAU9CXU0_9BACT|nr:hypothetical protein FUAX_27290 [Fulvitalea axinellae]
MNVTVAGTLRDYGTSKRKRPEVSAYVRFAYKETQGFGLCFVWRAEFNTTLDAGFLRGLLNFALRLTEFKKI